LPSEIAIIVGIGPRKSSSVCSLTAGAGDQALRQIVVDAPVTLAVGISQRAAGHGGAEPQPIKLVVPGAQANFYYVGQAIPISKLGKGHSQELVPTGEVINLAVAIVASDAATKLLRVDPLGELRKDQFSGRHDTSLAFLLLRKTTKPSPNRSHQFSCACACFNSIYNCNISSIPDDNDFSWRSYRTQNPPVRASAINALKEIDPAVAVKAGIK
jgi:hypothetical protein